MYVVRRPTTPLRAEGGSQTITVRVQGVEPFTVVIPRSPRSRMWGFLSGHIGWHLGYSFFEPSRAFEPEENPHYADLVSIGGDFRKAVAEYAGR